MLILIASDLMDKKVILVSIVALVVLALMATMVIAADPAPVQNSISYYLKLMNANIVEGKNAGSTGLIINPQVSASVITKGNVTYSVKDKEYVVNFKAPIAEVNPANNTGSQFCVVMDKTDFAGNINLGTKPPAVCFYNPSKNLVLTNSIFVALVVDGSNYSPLDCYAGVGSAWAPSAGQAKQCDYTYSNPTVTNFLNISSSTGIVYAGDSMTFNVKILNGKGYPN